MANPASWMKHCVTHLDQRCGAAIKICNDYGRAVCAAGRLLSNVVNSATAGRDEIAVSMERMNAIQQIDRLIACEAEAGVILSIYMKRQEKSYLFFLWILRQRELHDRGNIASNAGGLVAVRYGVMRNLVPGLQFFWQTEL